MRVLVTGGTGFTGKALALRLLGEGHEVTAFDCREGLRTDERRPGHGLGLAIVADIVSQYGGSVRYGRSTALGGLRVELRLPLPAG